MNDAETLTPKMIPVSIRSTNSLASHANANQLVIDIPKGGVSFEDVEKRLIEHTLSLSEWNKNQTARMLEILRPRLLRKIEKYRLDPYGKGGLINGTDLASPIPWELD